VTLMDRCQKSCTFVFKLTESKKRIESLDIRSFRGSMNVEIIHNDFNPSVAFCSSTLHSTGANTHVD